MQIKLAHHLQTDSIVDGEGLRAVVWTQGCSHNCLGCHNPDTHSFEKGFKYTTEKLNDDLSKLKNHDGITFSGGDPMFQPGPCAEIAGYAKSIGLNVWCYTGFTFEQLLIIAKANPKIKSFMEQIDVLVDGKFVLEQKSLDIIFRGSRNQRILDMQKSLKAKKPILIKKYIDDFVSKAMYEKNKYMYI